MTLTPRSSTRRSRWRYAAFAATNASLTAALIAGGGATPATASVVTNHHASFPTEGFADPALVSQWYTITNQTVAAAGFPQPVTQSDAWSVSWLAAARAVDAGRNQSFQEAAFAQALHDTLAAQVPGQQSNLDADLTSTLAAIPNGPAKSAGIARGQQQAASVLAERANDGLATAAVDIPYTPPRRQDPAYGSRRHPPTGQRSEPARATARPTSWRTTTSSTRDRRRH